MLELQNAQRVYRAGTAQVAALHNVNLRIADGEMVAIMGPSGSGKSTLLNVLGCLDDLSDGLYLLDGKPVAGLTARALANLRNRTFGFVFQFFGLISEYTAVENVMLPLLYGGTPPGEARKRSLALLERLNIGQLRDKRPTDMSGGQQQRVAIARALVGDARVILADEPTGSLDSVSGTEVLNLLAERHQQGYTVLIVTHSADVSARCGRVLNMRDGQTG